MSSMQKNSGATARLTSGAPGRDVSVTKLYLIASTAYSCAQGWLRVVVTSSNIIPTPYTAS
ncbi:hypothetical protein SNOG_09716 [Parastagonospora nodorum SN15]|uniref:Uncharacterized protein n=1 Tax=Phaeosphaeria nodorum (strain SN15 / ATCC MYA-4574 / FGSC 10173) TaxID=321614 RepID=Q0UEU8_PHANO|nr:hypothetical protein SNOG_09716 [Parastagonospora nodorum SN15]EAT82981.1 hypothetical protein SNOG_09716 [Parastagonospora nodorum SN15]